MLLLYPCSSQAPDSGRYGSFCNSCFLCFTFVCDLLKLQSTLDSLLTTEDTVCTPNVGIHQTYFHIYCFTITKRGVGGGANGHQQATMQIEGQRLHLHRHLSQVQSMSKCSEEILVLIYSYIFIYWYIWHFIALNTKIAHSKYDILLHSICI